MFYGWVIVALCFALLFVSVGAVAVTHTVPGLGTTASADPFSMEDDYLSELAMRGGILNDVKVWPKELRSDSQLTTAYTYLRGWGFFQPQHLSAVSDKARTP